MNLFRLLLVEDNDTDALLTMSALRAGAGDDMSFSVKHVRSLSSAATALQSDQTDCVLVDLGLPDAEGLEAVRQIQAHSDEIPVVVLTGQEDEALALDAVREGAQDYISKNEFTGSALAKSVLYAIERHALRKALLEKNDELEMALAEVRTLRGLITICCVCKNVVNEQGTWEAIDKYVRDRSDANFSHGYCPHCAPKDV